MKVTRTITTFSVKAVRPDFATMTFNVIGECECVATHMTKTIARKALIERGINVPRGTEVTFDKTTETLYACSLEDFLKIAVPVSADEVDGEDIA